MKKVLSIYTMFFFIFVQLSVAQDIKKDVTVVKPYEPVVQDASKISLLPEFNDTLVVNPKFDYKISPIRLTLPFQPRPVPAAKMAQEPIKNLYNNYIRLGYGTPFSPLAEVSVTNGRSKENAVGFYLRHHSANGSVKIANNKSIDAPYAENEMDLYGKHLFKETTLSGNVFYTSDKTTFYGIDPTVNLTYNASDFKQVYQNAGFIADLGSNNLDSSKLIYNASTGFSYLSDNYKVAESHFLLNGSGGQVYKDFFVGGSMHLDYFKPGNGNDSVYNTIFTLRPSAVKKSELWRLEVALGLTFDSNNKETKMYSYPSALFEFNVAPSVLKAFVAYEGNLEANNLDKIRLENPFILPGQRVKNTNYKTHIYGGLKGSFSSSVNFLAMASYAAIENQYFFINDTLMPLHNFFQVVYDDIDKIQVSAELNYSASEKLAISAKGNFYSYSTFRQAKPWHLPQFDATLGVRYNLRDKIILTSDAFMVGERYAKTQTGMVSLDSYVDINLGAEYRYTKLLSAFIQMRNLTASKYKVWNQYPSYRFQIMAGFTYMF